MPLLYHRSILLLTVIPSPPNCRKFASYSPRLKWLLTLRRGGNLFEMIICKVVGFALFIFLEENTFKSTLLMISLCTHMLHSCTRRNSDQFFLSISMLPPWAWKRPSWPSFTVLKFFQTIHNPMTPSRTSQS